ncbi:MAG TPA: hypothetical protein VGO67_15870 [Verrucomicrobiae bacterium]|jgi:uncharacterized repeat protein (TIGR01451 family)
MKFPFRIALLAVFLLTGLTPSFADIFVINNTASSGPGSLSDTLNNLLYGSSNTIAFNIPGPGIHTIIVQSGIYVPNNTIIDGYTQPGAQANSLTNGDNAVLLIELRAGTGEPNTGLNVGSGCTIRGLVMNGFGSEAVSASSGDVIQGNFIGTDPSGTIAEGNEYYGIFVELYGVGGTVLIGGPTPADRNLISGNHYAGIDTTGSAGATLIQGNLIGTDITGSRPMGNLLYGVVNYGSGNTVQVGGTNVGEGNVLAYNGIGVWNYPGLGVSVLGNSIFANEGLGIAQGGLGYGSDVSPPGPGGFAPAISSATVSGGNTAIQGTLQGANPNTGYRIEFFANSGPGSLGYAQGQKFLGAKTILTGSDGSSSFSATFPGSFPFVSATATGSLTNTSEFSADYSVPANSFAPGDLLIGLFDGLVQWRHADGTLVAVLNPGFGWDIPVGGIAFDKNNNFYVTGQSNSIVVRYNPSGQSLGVFASNVDGYSADIAFDAKGNAFVASQYSSTEVTEYDSSGKTVADIDPNDQLSGLYRFQLGADQQTAYFDGFLNLIISIYYLPFIERYNLTAQQELSILYQTSTNVNSPSIYGFRLLADGGAVLSGDQGLARISIDPIHPLSAAHVTQTYSAPGADSWDPIALDIDGRSFWAGTDDGSFIYKFDIASGQMLERIDIGVSDGVASMAVVGGPVASTTGLFLGIPAEPAAAIVGETVTNTITLLNFHTNALAGVTVTDTLPPGTTFSSGSTSLGTLAAASGKVTFNLGTVPAGTNVTMTVAFISSSAGTLTNSVTANATGPATENYSAASVTVVQAKPGPLVVTTTSDSGAGSLRAAIANANAAAGTGDITFNITGSGPHIIQPLSPLPTLTAPVTINGYSESGTALNTASATDNAKVSIALDGANAGTLADGLTITGGNSVIEGLAIYNFSGDGIVLTQNDGDSVTGNFIGVDADGNAAPNGKNGILISGSLNNSIGGAALGQRNLISANGGSGIGITGYNAGNNAIKGNFIGVDHSGGALGNMLNGALVSASEVVIGGTNSGDGNVIAFNGASGVSVFGTTSYSSEFATETPQFTDGVGILGNSIYGNGELGIDMAPAGVNSNFSAGQFTGPDNRLSSPVILPLTPGSTAVAGMLSSDSDETFRIELFANTLADASGFGQGQTFLSAVSVTTDDAGLASFNVPVSTPLADGEIITATAIELDTLNTSEFSQAVQVAPAANVSVTISTPSNPAQARQNLTYTITVANQGPGIATDIVLTNQTPPYATFVSADSGGTTSYGNPPAITWSLGSLAAGASTNIQVVVMPTQVGTITTTAGVSSLESDPTFVNNLATLNITVTGTPRTLTVKNTSDSGPDSLRAAITDVDANGYGLDTIQFNIPGSGVQTIMLQSDLPYIQEPVTIDGYSQPGAQANTETNGDNAVLLIQLQENGYSYSSLLSVQAGNTTVRGLVINGVGSRGIFVSPNYNSPPQANVVIAGNFIGVSPAGTAVATNNLEAGIEVDGYGLLSGVQIGGANPADRNIISGNGGPSLNTTSAGIYVYEANGVTIQGNYIGTDATGRIPIGNNGAGVLLYSGDNETLVGGGGPGRGNIIANNATIGVQIGDGTNNSVLGNSIFDNGGMGIHLGYVSSSDPGSPTPNHVGGPIQGPNNLQNYPVLTSVTASGGNTTVQGTLNSQPNTNYRLEFFSNARPSGTFYGEGQTFIGAKAVVTDSSGNADFTFTFPLAAANVTATATDPAGNTSEFSADVLPAPGTFQTGDLFIGSVNGQIQWRRNDGAPVALLNAGVTNNIQLLAFSPGGVLIAGAGDSLIMFGNQGNLLGILATNINARSLAFDSSGNFYVASGGNYLLANTGPIFKFGPSGNLLKTFTVAGDEGAPAYLDLAADQHTIVYTSYGTSVDRYDVAALLQLSDLTTNLLAANIYTGYDVRLLPDGSALVGGGSESIARFDAAGKLIQTYAATNSSGDFNVLAIDPDNTSFWVSTYYNPSFLYRFDLASGKILLQMPTFLPSGDGESIANGSFAIFGEPRAAAVPAPVLSISGNRQNVVVSWPENFSDFVLQTTQVLSPPTWINLTVATNSITLPVTNTHQFFRLIKR